MRIYFALFLFVSVFVPNSNAATSISVWYKNIENEHQRLFLELIIQRAEHHFGEVELQSSEVMSQQQAFDSLRLNDSDMDIVIGGVSSERESDFLPIYYPIDRGLLGFRICLITPETQTLFDQVRQPKDFAELGLSVGIGEFRPNAFVLKHNGIPLKTAATSDELLSLLKQQDIACFSRGINEITEEINKLSGIVAEQNILLVYPMAEFIFVRKGAEHIQEILQLGLDLAIADGSFARLFTEYYGNAIEVFSIYQRKLMFLDNPDLSEQAKRAVNQYGIASFTGFAQ